MHSLKKAIYVILSSGPNLLAARSACGFIECRKPSPCAGAKSASKTADNTISAYLDGSVVYGLDKTRADALRTFQGGTLKISAGNLPPLNTAVLPNANDAHVVQDDQLFSLATCEPTKIPELASVQALFVRAHNRLASEIAKQNPKLSDEQVYQHARAIVVAEFSLTYKEFLPALLATTPQATAGYKPM